MNTLVRENQNGRQTEQFIAPAASITENGDGYTLQVEMPGVSKEGLEISIENNELTIIGRRSMPAVDGTLIHRESRPESFRRAFELDPSIDTGKNHCQDRSGNCHAHATESGASEAAQNRSFISAKQIPTREGRRPKGLRPFAFR